MHQPGPWRQGKLLSTKQTRQMYESLRHKLAEEEKHEVYANFHDYNEGQSRVRVATVVRLEDVPLIVAAPDGLAIAKKLLAIFQDPQRSVTIDEVAELERFINKATKGT